MYILTVRAFADFDIPYNVNITAFESSVRVNALKDKLNELISNHPKVDCDIRISEILEDENFKNEFIETCKFVLLSAIPMSGITLFCEKCFEIFQKNYVYLNTNIFEICEVKVIS